MWKELIETPFAAEKSRNENHMKICVEELLCVFRNAADIPFLSLFTFRMEEEPVEVKILKPDSFEKLVDKETQKKASLWITDNKDLAVFLERTGRAVLLYENPLNRTLEDDTFLQENTDYVHFPYVLEGFEEIGVEYLDRIYRRLHNLPWDILETDRLFVRETIVEDLPAFYKIYEDASVTEFTEGLFDNPGDEEEYLKAYINTVYRFFETGIYTVILKETGEIIGRAGLERREGYEELELGFLIGVDFQKKGYAFEVCSALLQYAKDYFPEEQIHAFVEPGNTVSGHLLEKLGFCCESEKLNLLSNNKEGGFTKYLEYRLP